MVDINKFHAQGNDIASWINQPFAINGRVCATDRHIILILHNQDCSGYAPLETNERGVMRLIDTIESSSGYASVEKEQIAWPEKIKCIICKGCGHATKEKCEECNGEGVSEARNDYSTYYDLECASCDGIGYETDTLTEQTCPDCEGTGETFKKQVCVEIMGITVQAKYLSLVIDEPELQFSANIDKQMLMFKIGVNAFGAIMSFRVEK